MNKKINLALTGCLFTSMLSADVSTDIKSTFTKGTINGDIVLYSEQQHNSGLNKDAGFTMGSIGLGYETVDFHGFKGTLGFRTNSKFNEKENSDYDGGNSDYPKSLLHTANVSYVNDDFSLALGRQEIDLEWISDFHEAYVGTLTTIPDTTIVALHSDKIAVADCDAVLESFKDIEKHGVNVLDVKYEGIGGLVLNAYYYNIKDVADYYGAKIDYDMGAFGITTQYALSDEDVVGQKDGSIANIEIRGGFSDISLSIGYITTDKKAGVGSMEKVGENINPLEDGNQAYVVNSDTVYISASYEISKISIDAIYGNSDYGVNKKEKEFNLGIEYNFNDEFAIGTLFVNVNAENSDDDYKKCLCSTSYSF